jgi:hypothetical protein
MRNIRDGVGAVEFLVSLGKGLLNRTGLVARVSFAATALRIAVGLLQVGKESL